jgi:hypothetical protein
MDLRDHSPSRLSRLSRPAPVAGFGVFWASSLHANRARLCARPKAAPANRAEPSPKCWLWKGLSSLFQRLRTAPWGCSGSMMEIMGPLSSVMTDFDGV